MEIMNLNSIVFHEDCDGEKLKEAIKEMAMSMNEQGYYMVTILHPKTKPSELDMNFGYTVKFVNA